VLKKRLLDEGNETVTNCNALKMKAMMEKCDGTEKDKKVIGFHIEY